MITATPGLIDFLNSGRQFYIADLLTLTLVSGDVLRHTNFDIDLTAGGHVFRHDGMLYKRAATKITRGISVDTNELNLYPQAGYSLGGAPFLPACVRGALDGAKVLIERAYMPTAGDTALGTVWRFSGWVAESEVRGNEVMCTARSLTERLNVKWPRNLFQPSCLYTLFDAGCGLNKASFVVSGASASGSTKSLVVAGLAQPAGYFDMGVIAFTGGINAGARRTIKSHVSGGLHLTFPLIDVPGPGDAFQIWPGCDKTRATCEGKFSNLSRWRAYPYVPVPEAAL